MRTFGSSCRVPMLDGSVAPDHGAIIPLTFRGSVEPTLTRPPPSSARHTLSREGSSARSPDRALQRRTTALSDSNRRTPSSSSSTRAGTVRCARPLIASRARDGSRSPGRTAIQGDARRTGSKARQAADTPGDSRSERADARSRPYHDTWADRALRRAGPTGKGDRCGAEALLETALASWPHSPRGHRWLKGLPFEPDRRRFDPERSLRMRWI